MVYGTVKYSAITLSVFSMLGLVTLTASFDSRAQTLMRTTSDVPRATLEWQVFMQPKTAIVLAEGEVLKVRSGADTSASQCFIKNEKERKLRLTPPNKLGARSIAGSVSEARFRDWEFSMPQTGLSVYCEFPNGVTYSQLYNETGKILAAHFKVFPPETAAVQTTQK